MNIKNYASKALVDGKNHFRKYRMADEAEYKGLLEDIEAAVHFSVPDGGDILGNSGRSLQGTQLRLPYPVISVEVDLHDLDNVLSPCLIVAKEGLPPGVDKPSAEIAIFVSVWFRGSEGPWAPLPLGSFFPNRAEQTSSEGFDYFPCPALPLLAGKALKLGVDSTLQSLLMTCGYVLLELLEALSCSNVTQEVAQEARKKGSPIKSKYPKYEVKTLVVTTHTAKHARRTDGAGGIHASPRQHLRRGHIRRLHDGRKIFVNSCVVGSAEAGVIGKDYKVKK